ncbi:MAG: hypothetical protein KBT69_06045 [Oceanihabitans sp.]|nr:hypothetical protein [Oceanihabitans sp.]
MNFKYFNTILIVLLVCNVSAFAQKRKNNIDKEFPTSIAFPYSYLGDYSGNLRVSNNTGAIANIPTEFALRATDKKEEFVYTITYIKGKDKKEVNTYTIFILDEEKGFYAIADNTGLQFTATLIDNTLFSTFEINNNIMFTALEFTNSGKVKLNIMLSEKINNTRTKELKIDEARSSNVILVQKAVLSKLYK